MAKLLKNVEVGSIVKINEGGSPVEFYVARHNYEVDLNEGGKTLLVRKEVYDQRAWNSSGVNTYANSDIDVWLNSEYASLLDESILSKIGETTFYYTVGNGDTTVATLSRKLFLLSVTELGLTPAAGNAEGATLPIADALKVAYKAGVAQVCWLRTAKTDGTTYAYGTNTGGVLAYYQVNSANRSVRPVFALPASEIYVAEDGMLHLENPLTISYGETELGDHIDSVEIPYMATTASGAEIAVTEYLDGKVTKILSAASGVEQKMFLSARGAVEGIHTFKFKAEADGDMLESEEFHFNVPTIALGNGGSIQEMQDGNGDPVFPATLAKAVLTVDGKSAETLLVKLGTSVETLAEDLRNRSKIATGSYVGTGTSGEENEITLPLPFEPKLFFIYASPGAAYHYFGLWVSGSPIMFVITKSSSVGVNINHVTVIENSISWYGSGVNIQFNSENNNYWVAIS